MEYNYYFDEAFHTRKITSGSFKDMDYFNSYISIGMGFQKSREKVIYKIFDEFEKRQKIKYGFNSLDKELKSEVVTGKHYKYGLATFNNLDIDLYNGLFDIMLNNEIFYYISICDKLDYLLAQCTYDLPYVVNKKAITYSIVKLVNVYRPQKVIMDILEKSNELIIDLKEFCINQLKSNGDIELKKSENDVLSKIIVFLDKVNAENVDFSFDYNFIFLGFSNYVDELKMKKVNVYIDNEGTNKIYNCASNYLFNKVEQLDSKKSMGIRISDMMCGFVSKIMRAIYEDTKNNPNVPYKTKHWLNEKWFLVDENQFNLYKKISKYIKREEKIYYASFVSNYFDLFVQFIGLIYYFDNYCDYKEYSAIEKENHFNKGNVFILSYAKYFIDRMEKEYGS